MSGKYEANIIDEGSCRSYYNLQVADEEFLPIFHRTKDFVDDFVPN